MTLLTRSDDRGDRLWRRLALAAVLLMAVVVVASAWLRLAQARPACVDWPGCRGAQVPALKVAADATLGAPAWVSVARAAHRLTASTLLVVVLALMVVAARGTRAARTTGTAGNRPDRPPDAALLRRAAAMLALALGLAALGIVTPGARSNAVMLGNLLGGLLLFALAWATWRGLDAAPPLPRALVGGARAVALLWLLQAALGARSGTGVGGAGEVAPVAHLALAMIAAPSAFAVGWFARRQGRIAEGAALIVLALLQFVLGAAAASLGAAPALVLVHNAAAALGLALLLGLGLAQRR